MKEFKKITIAHSPDADDAFMFYALANGHVDTEGIEVEHQLKDIQTLNQWAHDGRYEVTAISFHAYPEVQEQYQLVPTGGSYGEKDYGPMIVKKPQTKNIRKVAIPGMKTTAFLLFKLWDSDLDFVEMPFDQIMDAVLENKVDAGLIIHEGQLRYEEMGLECVINFGAWWYDQFKLPLPLGGNIIRRDIPEDLRKKITEVLNSKEEK